MALVYQSSYKAAMLLLVGFLFLQASGPALGSNGKTCYSRQHRDAIVDVRVAVERNGAITSSRVKPAEKDCILACCSEEVEPGVKCNMVVYKPSSQAGMDNCYLFHCETEQDCPLVAAKPGTNTYDISKDVIHPTAKGNGRTTVMPIIHATPVKQPVATQTTSTAMRPTTTTTTPRIMQPSTTTTTTQPTTTTSTTQTTTTTTALPTTTTQATTTSTTTTTKHPPTELAIVLVTMPVVTMPSSPPTTTTTTTTTTQLTICVLHTF
uniref:MANSC domain-containing protein n=1 Tax=Pygocentrus nattereri TaxID=42514 RepID=A0AAR2K0E1_PYGNA